MALPNPSMSFSPFAILTADQMNDLVENDQALAAGTGLNTGVITTAKIADANVTSPKVAAGFVVQSIITNSSAVATSGAVIPQDDTIPQNTEGFEVMTVTITPKSATNTLKISANIYGGSSVNDDLIIALFQDSTTNAIAAVGVPIGASGGSVLHLEHSQVSGTTSAITFRIRFGGSQTGTRTFNGRVGTRVFGAITKSSLTVEEIKV